ncbi:MAG TPA: ATP-binding protein [Rubricoccaceae bacterium]|nr:ATP-binding protein [Rubricoccaceae bacterium]
MAAPAPPLNRLALRIAAAAAIGAGTAGLVLLVLPVPLPVGVVLASLAAGGTAYAAAQRRVGRRLALAQATLEEARERRFAGVARLDRAGEGDELDELMEQVRRAGRALQEEIERLEKLEHYRRDFLGDVSHELKTPIFAIAGFAESLLDGALDDERVRRRFVEKILDHARRLDALARDLVELSRIESGELEMVVAPFDLRALARETTEALEPLAADRRITLDVRVPADLPPALGDRERLRQVLANLVENGIKYSEPEGHVRVEAHAQPDGDVRVAVVDDGVGIPPEHVARITERFYRVDRSRSREQGGTGLGLAIVKHILEAHGQRLQVESHPGHGSTFSFTLASAAGGGEPGRVRRRY